LLRVPGNRLPEPEAVGIAIKVLAVLDYLHKQTPPVIFRDLKPDNMMLRPDSELKLIDFGIARFFRPTGSNIGRGTVGYAAPEQYQGAIDARSDIYALGATLHHMLTGRDPAQHPFDFPPILKLVPNCDPNLAVCVDLALERDPARRPQSAAEFRDRIRTKSISQPSVSPTGESRDRAVDSAQAKRANAPTLLIAEIPCYQCRALIPIDSRFCTKCGHTNNLSDPATPNADNSQRYAAIRPEDAISRSSVAVQRQNKSRVGTWMMGVSVGIALLALGGWWMNGRRSRNTLATTSEAKETPSINGTGKNVAESADSSKGPSTTSDGGWIFIQSIQTKDFPSEEDYFDASDINYLHSELGDIRSTIVLRNYATPYTDEAGKQALSSLERHWINCSEGSDALITATDVVGNMGSGATVFSNSFKPDDVEFQKMPAGHWGFEIVRKVCAIRGWLGVEFQRSTEGVLITDVYKEGPAAKAGIQRGDIVVEYGGKPVRDPGEFKRLIAESAIGSEVKVNLFRDGKRMVANLIAIDFAEGRGWLRQAATQGDTFAQVALGTAYYEGWGGELNYAEAISWFRRAAEHGNAIGQYELGMMYENGIGVARDNDQALTWYRKAAAQGSEEARKAVDRISSMVSVPTAEISPMPSTDGYECHNGSASFDCTKGNTIVERTICSSVSLAKKDCLLGYVFRFSMLDAISNQIRQNILLDERHWISERDKFCESKPTGELANCLNALTDDRGKYLINTYKPDARGAFSLDDFN
jgi:serine/threonine protein kinase